MENKYQNQLLSSRIELLEHSFRCFSEEIHDNIGQLLSIVKMQLYTIRNSSKEPGTVTAAGECSELVSRAIHDLRTASHALNGFYVNDVGLIAAVQRDIDHISLSHNLQFRLQVTGDKFYLGQEYEMLIFSIIHEAINNAIRHALPTIVDVKLTFSPDKLTVVIADNGSGFEVQCSEIAEGSGLANMRERADLLKGAFEICSIKDQGTSMKLEINRPTELPET